PALSAPPRIDAKLRGCWPMRFAAEHRFASPVDAAIAGLTDPALHRELPLPDLRLLEVDGHPNESETVLRVRYDFVGPLDPLARRLLGGQRLTWVQELRLDPDSGAGRLPFPAQGGPGRPH